MNRQIDRWIDKQINWTDVQIDVQIYKQINRWMDKDEEIYKYIDRYKEKSFNPSQ